MSENVKNDRLRPRLEKFDKIIFDMDGVITSEYMYWEAAALTVYELLFSYEKFGRRDIDREYCLKTAPTWSTRSFVIEKRSPPSRRLALIRTGIWRI